ncbi:MAG: hypothetical protein ACYC2G_04060 [Gemmatimonadaceae bacterium]
MPLIPFDTLPPSARVWVFGSRFALDDNAAARLLAETDRFLEQWNAHGHPLYSGREWRDDRFLTIAVDQSTAGASGCSIDGLYRALRTLETVLGTELLGGGIVFYREPVTAAGGGAVRAVERSDFVTLAAKGEVDRDTTVFDLSVETLGEWRERFEGPAHGSWHAALVERSGAGA